MNIEIITKLGDVIILDAKEFVNVGYFREHEKLLLTYYKEN